MCRSEITLLLLAGMVTLSFQAISTRVEEITLIYPPKVRSERDLSICEGSEICSVVHRRFWLRPTVQRLCRCPTGHECPWNWAADNRTMPLNNRAQVKFCDSIVELPECTSKEAAVNVTRRVETVRPTSGRDKSERRTRELATAACRCPQRHYWKLHRDVEQREGNASVASVYRCSKLRKCATGEFCANVRADYFSAYYRCSCPVGHMCLFRNGAAAADVTELLYDGPGYHAVCTGQ